MVYILSSLCKFAITRKNGAFVAKIANTHLKTNFMADFALAEKSLVHSGDGEKKVLILPWQP